jgi:hypothetical protein
MTTVPAASVMASASVAGVLLFSTLDRERAFVRQAPSGMRNDRAGVSHHPDQ